MTIALIGESCTGKSTIAASLAARLNATVYTGKDYLKLAKSEPEARKIFCQMLEGSDPIIYVITESEHLNLLPPNALRVVVTAALDTIAARFAARMNGNLPEPVRAALERKHGMFDDTPCALCVDTDTDTVDIIADMIVALTEA